MSRHRTLALVLALLCALTAFTGPAGPAGAASGPSAQASSRAAFAPMQLGDTGWRVRQLQSRLHQLDLPSEVVTSRFDAETRAGVATFQRRRGWRADGVVDQRTWEKIVARTTEPTSEALHNVYTPGPALLQRGDSGMWVRQVQARLKQVRWFDGRVTGRYGGSTVEAVEGFQAKREIPVTGEVDRRTWGRLLAMTSEPSHEELHNIVPAPSEGAPLDPRCLVGEALCIDKSTYSLRYVVDGDVQMEMDVRFGAELTPTREGEFEVEWKDADHVSSLYHTEMPYSMFFSGGQAVHYSSDFATYGYSGASHGCVNVRDYDAIAQLYDLIDVGDTVVVYWS